MYCQIPQAFEGIAGLRCIHEASFTSPERLLSKGAATTSLLFDCENGQQVIHNILKQCVKSDPPGLSNEKERGEGKTSLDKGQKHIPESPQENLFTNILNFRQRSSGEKGRQEGKEGKHLLATANAKTPCQAQPPALGPMMSPLPVSSGPR